MLQQSTTSPFECTQTINGSTNEGIVYATFDLCDFVVDDETTNGWYEAVDNRSVGNMNPPNNGEYKFYFNVASNIINQVPSQWCDNWNTVSYSPFSLCLSPYISSDKMPNIKTWRRLHGLDIGYCSQIRSEGLPNATCFFDDIVPINSTTAAYQIKTVRTMNHCSITIS